jgi:hypothetical protein
MYWLYWYTKKSRWVRSVAVAAVAGIILLGVAPGASAHASTSGTGSVQSAADDGCTQNYPHRVNFYYRTDNPYDNEVIVPDLTVCTNSESSVTTITNTSESVVWHVNQPRFPYWTMSEDLSSPLNGATLLFRTWITAAVSNRLLTIEPGLKVTLWVSPDTIQLGHNAGEEATWQLTSLMADSFFDKAHETFISILTNNASPTGKAVIECANAAYGIGQSLYGQDQPQGILSQLSTGLGIAQDNAKCARAVDDAQRAAVARGEPPAVTLQDIRDEARTNAKWGATDGLVGDIVKFIKAARFVRA